MILMLLSLVAVAISIIYAVIVWGARNGTLRDSDQERFDHRFHRIATPEAYSRFPRLPDSVSRPTTKPLQLR